MSNWNSSGGSGSVGPQGPPGSQGPSGGSYLSVDLVSTVNVTLSGEQTIDGILTSGSRVFVPYQTDAKTSGIYLTSSGAWTRTTDYNSSALVDSSREIIVKSGTIGSGTIWTLQTVPGLTLGTTNLYYSLVKTGSSNVSAAKGSLVVSGDSNTIENVCTDAAIVGGTGKQIKNDPSPGTKLYNNSIGSFSTGGVGGIITGSDAAFIIGGDGSSITTSPYSSIIGGSPQPIWLGTPNTITGSAFQSNFSAYSMNSTIIHSDGSSIDGDGTGVSAILSSIYCHIGTISVFKDIFSTAIIASLNSAIKNSNISGIYSSNLSLLGNNLITINANCAILGGRSNLLGTVTAGTTSCVIIGGNTNAIQNASVNCTILGGASNLITNVTSASIVSGTSNTITTTSTNSIIGAGSSNTITTALRAFIGAGSTNSITSGASSAVIVGGASNTTAAPTSFIGAGTSNLIEAACVDAAIVNGLSNQIKDDPTPGTKLLARSAQSIIVGGSGGIITGSGISALVANEGGAVSLSPGSVVIGSVTLNGLAPICSVEGSGIAANLSSFSFCNSVISSWNNCHVYGNKSQTNIVVASETSTIGTLANTSACAYNSIIGGVSTTINNSFSASSHSSQSGIVGSVTLSGCTEVALLACGSCLLGTVTAGVTRCTIIASSGSAIQNAAVNCTILGGSSNLITNTTSASIVSGASNTITTTATGSIIGAGSTNTITTATQAGIFTGTSNQIGSGSTNSAIIAGTSNLIGTVTAGVTSCVIIGGNSNAIQNASVNCTIHGGSSNLITNVTSAAIVTGASNTITTTATNSIIGGGSTNTITTALQAGIFTGTSNQIGSGSTNSAIIAGTSNLIGTVTAGSTLSIICSGTSNSIQNGSSNCFIGSGLGNTMTTVPTGVIVGGTQNGIDSGGSESGILAGKGARTYLSGMYAHACGQTEAGTPKGNRQQACIVARGDTPGSAANESIELKLGGYNGAPGLQIVPEINKTYFASIKILAMTSLAGTGLRASWNYDVMFQRSSAGVVTVPSIVPVSAGTTNPSGWTVAFTAGTTPDRFVITFSTGAGNTAACRVVANIDWIECLFA